MTRSDRVTVGFGGTVGRSSWKGNDEAHTEPGV